MGTMALMGSDVRPDISTGQVLNSERVQAAIRYHNGQMKRAQSDALEEGDGMSDEFAGKELVMRWSEHFEHHVLIGEGWNGPAAAIDKAIREAGIGGGMRPNIDAESLRFEIRPY